MAEIKAHYRVAGAQNITALEQQLNFILSQLSERMDKIEGLCGNPKFYSTSFDFDATVSGFLVGDGASAGFEGDASEGLSALNIVTLQGITANTRNYTVKDSHGTTIHQFKVGS
jgi:hypothetical protein